jgi:nitrite reductase/ring-hydroxylating ferredoxin subunit
MFHDKQYIQLCKSGDIFPQKGKNFYFDEDVQIAVFRDNHQLFAVSNICPHQYAAVICNGFLEEKTVTCPLHGWIYSLESGKALGSNARLLTYHIFEDEGLVWLEQPKKTRPLWLENF